MGAPLVPKMALATMTHQHEREFSSHHHRALIRKAKRSLGFVDLCQANSAYMIKLFLKSAN